MDVPTEPSNFEICALSHYLDHFIGDVRDYDRLQSVFSRFEPEIVFHLAAQPIVRESYRNPKLTFDTNIGGTVNLLECVRRTDSVKAVVVITSDKCYKNFEWEWGYRECDILGGKDPYSSSKACSELICRSYYDSFFSGKVFPRVATARAGNVIGGGDWAYDRIIPDCVKAFIKREAVVMRNPMSVRPWQHVLEPLSGYLWLGALLLEKGSAKSGDAYNFGPLYDFNQTVQEVVRQFSEHWEGSRWLISGNKSEKRQESGVLNLNCDKARHFLKWHALLTLEETIRMTADWYKSHYLENCNMYQFSIKQINDYIEKAARLKLKWTEVV